MYLLKSTVCATGLCKPDGISEIILLSSISYCFLLLILSVTSCSSWRLLQSPSRVSSLGDILITFVERKERNILVKCNFCIGSKILSTAQNSNSNLLKHLQKQHAAMKLEATGTQTGTLSDATSPPPPPKQQRLDFNRGTVSQDKVDKAIARYVVEDMQAISGVTRLQATSYELKKTFEGLNYISTTADIWSAHNRSFMGITSHWINPTTLQRQKAALACKQIKGRHTYDLIAGEIDHIHSLYGVSTKVTSTVTDNGSNFVKAFAMYQPESFSDDDDEDHDDDDDVTFTGVAEALNTVAEEGIVLPPHQRCASHTLNLISCSDVEKWLVSNPGTKALYRSSANRSTLAAEAVSDVVTKKLLVPCTTRWNSFYEAVAGIVEIPMTDLGAITDRLKLKSISYRELHFLKDYCVTMKPLTVALDILQGEENCYFGTLLPTLETLMSKMLEVKDSLTVATGLPETLLQFASLLESNDAMLAAVTLPKFKLRWVRDQRKKERIKGIFSLALSSNLPGILCFPQLHQTQAPPKTKSRTFFPLRTVIKTLSLWRLR
uniref:BED-type domain-containing protein n=1 Tax=Cyprinodon variegatus TaxID=28743 RepID=A0A3Q2FWN7_CYPVA